MPANLGVSEATAAYLSYARAAATAAWPAVRHGLRLTAAVCLAFWVCFELELDAPYWAATSAAIACQPTLGASRRKGMFRFIGTVAGAVFVVTLAAAFPQNRWGFLTGLALWAALCGFAATLLSNFAAYAASLAGYTVAIIAGDASSSTDQVFTLAVSRASEITIGIACATVVVAATDLGQARGQLLRLMSGIIAEQSRQLMILLQIPGAAAADSRPLRRDVIKRVTALGPIIDAAFGEVSDLRERRAALLDAANGLYTVASEWRTLADHLGRIHLQGARSHAAALIGLIPPGFAAILSSGDARTWRADPVGKRDTCAGLARTLATSPADEPSLRLVFDRYSAALAGLARAANGLTLLASPLQAHAGPRQQWTLGGQDLLPPLVNALRVFVTVASVELFWILTEWPGGQGAVTFATIAIILMSPQNEKAVVAAAAFAWAMVLSVLLAAVTKFAFLPAQQSFAGLALALGVVMVPLGALSTLPRLAPYLVLAVANYGALMALTNVVDYNVLAFYNSALPIILGVCAAVVALYLIPPIPPRVRTANLLAATLAEFRRILLHSRATGAMAWEARVYRRLAAMPPGAAPIEGGRMVAAVAAGTSVLRLRGLIVETPVAESLQGCFQNIATGRMAEAFTGLSDIDQRLADVPLPAGPLATVRARAALRMLTEALDAHPAYFRRMGGVSR